MMRYSISDTAEYGDYMSGRRIITEETRKEMQKILRRSRRDLASKWIAENQAGRRANFLACRRMEAEHSIEKVGAKLRKMMSWLKK